MKLKKKFGENYTKYLPPGVEIKGDGSVHIPKIGFIKPWYTAPALGSEYSVTESPLDSFYNVMGGNGASEVRDSLNIAGGMVSVGPGAGR